MGILHQRVQSCQLYFCPIWDVPWTSQKRTDQVLDYGGVLSKIGRIETADVPRGLGTGCSRPSERTERLVMADSEALLDGAVCRFVGDCFNARDPSAI